jgi:hypothetical protein
MPGRHPSHDRPTNGNTSGLSDLRALIRPKTNIVPVPPPEGPARATFAETKPDIDTVDQTTLDRLILLLSELEPRLRQYERTDSDTKQLAQLSTMAKLVNNLADRLVEDLPNCRDGMYEDGIRQATQYWLNSGELLDRNSPANAKGFLGLRKAMPPEWAARLQQQLGLAPRVVQSLLLALGLPLRTPESQAHWHGAVMTFVNDFRSTLRWTKPDERNS